MATGMPRVIITLLVFGAMSFLVLLRPRRWHEAWWTIAGALGMLALRTVSPGDALAATLDGRTALLFLLALLLLSLLVGKSGFFEWAAIRCAQFAHGDGRALYRNTFVLGALITATLSLDTTAVILTPIVLALVKRLRMPALPYVVLCAFVSNVGSLLLPISNLTNILFAGTFHLAFAPFAARMLFPQLVALAATYALLGRRFRRELTERFDPASLPSPSSVVPSRAYFVTSIAALVSVLVGYFFAPLVAVEPYVIAFGGVAVLAVAGAVTGRVRPRVAAEVSWGVFPFVIGLFIAVRGVENLGFSPVVSAWLARMHAGSAGKMLTTAAITALASNVMNNLPAALLMRGVLHDARVHARPIFAALVGANAGSIVTPFGSLATMLVLALARQAGVTVSTKTVVGLGAVLAPILVVCATLALAATFSVAR
jgi:arsenical pump membrane protein